MKSVECEKIVREVMKSLRRKVYARMAVAICLASILIGGLIFIISAVAVFSRDIIENPILFELVALMISLLGAFYIVRIVWNFIRLFRRRLWELRNFPTK